MICEVCHGSSIYWNELLHEFRPCPDCIGGISSCCDTAGANVESKMEALICMRLANMHRIHPEQDNSHVCHQCGHQVGIYPSGQAVLKDKPNTKIICEVCYESDDSKLPTYLAPGAKIEPFQSVRKKT